MSSLAVELVFFVCLTGSLSRSWTFFFFARGFFPREDLSLGLNGVPDLIVTLLLVLFSVVSRKAEKIAVEDIDIAQQTPQDYTGATFVPHYDML